MINKDRSDKEKHRSQQRQTLIFIIIYPLYIYSIAFKLAKLHLVCQVTNYKKFKPTVVHDAVKDSRQLNLHSKKPADSHESAGKLGRIIPYIPA